MDLEKLFIEQLRTEFRLGYDCVQIAENAWKFYYEHATEMSKNLREAVYDIRMMDAGPEFEMTEDEIKQMVKEKLGVIL